MPRIWAKLTWHWTMMAWLLLAMWRVHSWRPVLGHSWAHPMWRHAAWRGHEIWILATVEVLPVRTPRGAVWWVHAWLLHARWVHAGGSHVWRLHSWLGLHPRFWLHPLHAWFWLHAWLGLHPGSWPHAILHHSHILWMIGVEPWRHLSIAHLPVPWTHSLAWPHLALALTHLPLRWAIWLARSSALLHLAKLWVFHTLPWPSEILSIRIHCRTSALLPGSLPITWLHLPLRPTHIIWSRTLWLSRTSFPILWLSIWTFLRSIWTETHWSRFLPIHIWILSLIWVHSRLTSELVWLAAHPLLKFWIHFAWRAHLPTHWTLTSVWPLLPRGKRVPLARLALLLAHEISSATLLVLLLLMMLLLLLPHLILVHKLAELWSRIWQALVWRLAAWNRRARRPKSRALSRLRTLPIIVA